MKVQVLMSPECRHGTRALDMVADVVRHHVPTAEVETNPVATPDEAVLRSFPGSPTIRADGDDVEPQAPTSVGLG